MSTMASQITSVSIVFSTVCSGTDQRKHQSSTSLAFVRGIHWWPMNSPHKGPVTRKKFTFDDVIVFYCFHRQEIWMKFWMSNFQVIFCAFFIHIWYICCEIVLKWMPLDNSDDKSTLVKVMAWCREATRHYLNQCWHNLMSPYCVAKPRWVKYQIYLLPGNKDVARRSYMDTLYQHPVLVLAFVIYSKDCFYSR